MRFGSVGSTRRLLPEEGGKSYAQIARKLTIKTGTVKTICHRYKERQGILFEHKVKWKLNKCKLTQDQIDEVTSDAYVTSQLHKSIKGRCRDI